MDNKKTIDLLSQLVAIKSVYPKENKLGVFLFNYLSKLGFECEKQEVEPGRFNILAQRGSNPKVLFYGHLDTTPITREKEWLTEPLILTEKEGNLYGIGAYDMKGGIAAFLTALTQSKAASKVFLAVDEENISKGAWHAVEHKKGFFEEIELIISAEPNFGYGMETLTTERSGRCIFSLNIVGKGVHIAEYEKGVDAVLLLRDFIDKLYNLRGELVRQTGTVIQIRKVNGESKGMSVCGEIEVEVEALIGSEDSIENVQRTIQDQTEFEVKVKHRETPYLTGYKFNTFPYQEELKSVIKNVTKSEMRLASRASVGDDNVLATLGIPVITWGPDGGCAHTPNEYVEKDSILKLAQMFTQLLNMLN